MGSESLDESEAAMLERTCQRAKLIDGQRILEIGCGWGSSPYGWQLIIQAVKSSQLVIQTASASIKSQAVKRQLTNIEVVTCDINDFMNPQDASIGSYRLKCLSMFAIIAHY